MDTFLRCDFLFNLVAIAPTDHFPRLKLYYYLYYERKS